MGLRKEDFVGQACGNQCQVLLFVCLFFLVEDAKVVVVFGALFCFYMFLFNSSLII